MSKNRSATFLGYHFWKYHACKGFICMHDGCRLCKKMYIRLSQLCILPTGNTVVAVLEESQLRQSSATQPSNYPLALVEFLPNFVKNTLSCFHGLYTVRAHAFIAHGASGFCLIRGSRHGGCTFGGVYELCIFSS